MPGASRGCARCRRGRSRGEEGRSLRRPDKRLFIFLPMLPAARPPRWGEEALDNRWAHGSVTGGGVCAVTLPPRPRHLDGETWTGGAVMGTWHKWPFAGCRIPKP